MATRTLLTIALGIACGFVASCFDAPSADVMFSCDPDTAPACPDGYTCESDGCCHRDGSDFSAHAGECKTVATDGATSLLTSATGTDTSTDTGTGTTGTGTDATSSSDSGTDAASSSETGSTTDATSTGSESSAGSTDTGSSSTG
jgi:hypothetical protein